MYTHVLLVRTTTCTKHSTYIYILYDIHVLSLFLSEPCRQRTIGIHMCKIHEPADLVTCTADMYKSRTPYSSNTYV